MADSKPFEHVSQATLKEIAQSLMTMKHATTSISNSALAFMPLTDHSDTVAKLTAISQGADVLGGTISDIYRAIAREAAQI